MRIAQDGPGSGGARRDRTDDLKLAKLPLSQLSYGPKANAKHLPTVRQPIRKAKGGSNTKVQGKRDDGGPGRT